MFSQKRRRKTEPSPFFLSSFFFEEHSLLLRLHGQTVCNVGAQGICLAARARAAEVLPARTGGGPGWLTQQRKVLTNDERLSLSLTNILTVPVGCALKPDAKTRDGNP